MAHNEVLREPIVRESDDKNDLTALVADLGVRGVWQPQTMVLLDIRVVDTDAPSHINRSVEAVLISAELQKKRKYLMAAELRRASFTPFVLSVDGALGREALSFIKRLAEHLSLRWSKLYSIVMNWVRTRLLFATICATNLCLRGSRVKWRSATVMEDGAGLPKFLS